MKKITNEMKYMKYLFGYKRGVVISEQDETAGTSVTSGEKKIATVDEFPCLTEKNLKDYGKTVVFYSDGTLKITTDPGRESTFLCDGEIIKVSPNPGEQFSPIEPINDNYQKLRELVYNNDAGLLEKYKVLGDENYYVSFKVFGIKLASKVNDKEEIIFYSDGACITTIEGERQSEDSYQINGSNIKIGSYDQNQATNKSETSSNTSEEPQTTTGDEEKIESPINSLEEIKQYQRWMNDQSKDWWNGTTMPEDKLGVWDKWTNDTWMGHADAWKIHKESEINDMVKQVTETQNWYYLDSNNTKQGPISLEDLKKIVTPNMKVWAKGMEKKWVSVSELGDVFKDEDEPPAIPSPDDSASWRRRKRTISNTYPTPTPTPTKPATSQTK